MIDATNEKAAHQAEERFNYLVRQWDEAAVDCSHLYSLWQKANRRREQLAIAKTNAWGELEMARAMAVSNGEPPMRENLTDEAKRLLATLPREVWTEGPEGQMLLRLAEHGDCQYQRVNATLGRFALPNGGG